MELRQYIAIIWHRLWLLLLGVVVAGGAAFLVSRNMDPVYRSSVHLLINQAPSESGTEFGQIQVSERLARTYRDLIQKRPILEETISRLNLDVGPGNLASRISVAGSPDTQIIIIHVEDNDPVQAALIANTLVAVFIDQNQALQTARYREAILNWEQAYDQATALVENLEAEVAGFDEGAEQANGTRLARLEAQLAQARSDYVQTFSQLQSLRVAQSRELNDIVVVESAIPNSQRVRPSVVNNTLLAAIVGGMLALGIIFLIEYLDDTVKTPEQIAELAQLPLLGAIGSFDEPAEPLITRDWPRTPISEAYRVIRTNLSFAAVDGGLTTVLVTSASPEEGKSTTAANLAVVMAQASQNVILVDADLRRPRQHQIFDVANREGLTAAILDTERPPSHYLQKTNVSGLRLMTTGSLPPNPAELMSSQRMRQVIEQLQAEADMIIFDGSPVLSVTDPAILGNFVDGVLFVVEAGRTRQDALLQALEALWKTSVTVLGVVMNRVPIGQRSYYYNYYYRQYQNGYSYDDASSKVPSRSLWRRLSAQLWL
jgi:capsular exopolysaccharide synthesis family protein